MDLKGDLAGIVGSEYISDDPVILEAYVRDNSFSAPQKPRFVVKPKNVDEVQGIVKWANRTGTPLVPVSSDPPHSRGDTVPSLGGAVIVYLGRMKQITRINRRNKMVMVEPGVTFSQLEPELAKEGLRLPMPLLPRASKSVMTSCIEREPHLIPKYHWEMAEPVRCLEVVWGNGDRFTTGDAGTANLSLERQWEIGLSQAEPYGPGQVDFMRFVQGAQGTMGIVTWASLKCEVLPRLQKLFFVQSEKLDDLFDFTYKILRFRYGDELLLLNNSSLASILGKEDDQVRALRKELPQWVLILCVAGYDTLPKKRVEFQESDIRDIAQQFGLSLESTIPGAVDKQVLEVLSPSKETCWKLSYKGGYQDIFFITTLNRTSEFVKTMYSLSESRGYPTSDIGIYIQPVIQGVACHCEFNLPYDPTDPREVTKVKELLAEASEALIKEGAFFSRPYGIWADMAFNRDAQTTVVLKKIKGIFDPNNVMNPGKLCF
ncbi:FAD-binding oxidoreductase [Chloroflexota bacterium]